MSILRLLDGNGYIDSGEILFDGQDLTKLSDEGNVSHPWKSDLRHLPGADDRSEPGLHRVASALRAVYYPSGHDEEAGG